MNDYQTLQLEMGGQKLKEMSSFSFLQWMANKLSNVRSFSPEAVELTALVQSPPMSKNMPDEKKIEIINKLIKIGVQIP